MNLLTFDIEEWYTYELHNKGSKSYFEPILDKYLNSVLDALDTVDQKATFFCLGAISKNNAYVIKRIADRGHDVGCHSDKHQFLINQTSESFNQDTFKAISSIEQIIGKKVTMYRAPAFSITEKTKWAPEILISHGILIDSSIFPTKRSYGGFPSFVFNEPVVLNTASGSIKEFPISYANLWGKRLMFSGGGYFRLFPYWSIKSLMSKSDYNMAYFHLRDFDRHQVRNYSIRYFKSYYGIDGAYSKFLRFIDDFPFMPLSHADSKINWDEQKAINW